MAENRKEREKDLPVGPPRCYIMAARDRHLPCWDREPQHARHLFSTSYADVELETAVAPSPFRRNCPSREQTGTAELPFEIEIERERKGVEVQETARVREMKPTSDGFLKPF